MQSAGFTGRQWYVSLDGKQMGPYPEPSLREWLASGRVPAHALLSCGGPWMTTGQFHGQYGVGTPETPPVPRPVVSPMREASSLPRAMLAPPPLPAGVEGAPLIPVPAPKPIDQHDVRPQQIAAPPAIMHPAGPDEMTMTEAGTIGPMPVPAAVAAPAGAVAPVPVGAAPAGAPAAAATAAKPVMDKLEMVDDDSSPPERDRIVVLGRRQCGKTIFLACNYARFWKSLDGLTAKALSGQAHKQLMTVHQMLKDGEWPPSTLGTSQIELEIEYHQHKRLLVALDFAGELFAKAFLDEQNDWPGVKELVNHIDHAAAVLLLVDPSVVAGMDKQAAMEDDFGLVQAAERIRNWPGGELVPIVLVLTKVDQHQDLVDRAGGPLEFVRKHFPALVRLLRQIPIVQISCVQSESDGEGKLRPKRDSAPVNLDVPLRYCLKEIEKAEQQMELRREEDQKRMIELRLARERQERIRRQQLVTSITIGAIVLVGIAAVVLILVLKL